MWGLSIFEHGVEWINYADYCVSIIVSQIAAFIYAVIFAVTFSYLSCGDIQSLCFN